MKERGDMMTMPDTKLTRIGVFYDGGFFSVVSDYYKYQHARRARLSIEGLHRFAIHKVAEAEGVDERYCQVVDAHYFRGRFSAGAAEQKGKLLADRQFEDVLMRTGVVTHYLPQWPGQLEKGIDVWFALEAFELAVYKRFNVLVLVAGDGDYLALVRKLNTLGTRVMLLGWDFEYVDEDNRKHTTRTAQSLLEEVTYPIMMNTVIDDRTAKTDPVIRDLFVAAAAPLPVAPRQVRDEPAQPTRPTLQNLGISPDSRRDGKILSLHDGYGFIADDKHKADNWFFHFSGVVDDRFNELKVGTAVSYVLTDGDKGPIARDVAQ